MDKDLGIVVPAIGEPYSEEETESFEIGWYGSAWTNWKAVGTFTTTTYPTYVQVQARVVLTNYEVTFSPHPQVHLYVSPNSIGYGSYAVPDNLNSGDMNNWLNGKVYDQSVQWAPNKGSSVSANFTINLTRHVTSNQYKRIYWGVCISGNTGMDNTLRLYATASSKTPNISYPHYAHPSIRDVWADTRTHNSITFKATFNDGARGGVVLVTCAGTSKRIDNSGGSCTFTGLGAEKNYSVSWRLADDENSDYNFGTGSFNAATGYTNPSGLSFNVVSHSYDNITVQANWSPGTRQGEVVTSLNGVTKLINARNGRATFTGLKGNTDYTIYSRLRTSQYTDGNYGSITRYQTTALSAISYGEISTTDNSITIRINHNNTNKNLRYEYGLNGTTWYQSNSTTWTGSGCNPDTQYRLYAKIIRTTDNATKEISNGYHYTNPKLSDVRLALPSGAEHREIDCTAVSAGGVGNLQCRFKLDSHSYNGWVNGKTWTFSSGVLPNRTHRVYVEPYSNSSKKYGNAISKTITTWHTPLSGLTVNLLNRWYWCMEIGSSYNYSGSIREFKFSINSNSLTSTGTTNRYGKGSLADDGILQDKTNYTCRVEVTDNHGRKTSASANYRTLDANSLFLDGVGKEISIITPGGEKVVTPNEVYLIEPDGTTTNMNKIINNDDRTEYS